MFHFFLKKRRKTLTDITIKISMIYDLQFLRYRAKHTEIGNFSSFFALYPPPPKKQKKQKQKFWKMKQFAGDIIILHMCTKNSHSYDVQFLRYGVRMTEFFAILGNFLPFQPPDNPENQNFKIEKSS